MRGLENKHSPEHIWRLSPVIFIRVGDCNGGDAKDAKEFQTPPPIKKIKIPTSVGNQALEENEYGNKKKVTSPTTPSKTKTRTNGKKRNNQDRGPSPLTIIEETVPIKKHKIKVTNHNGSSPVVAPISNNTDTSLECPEPNCGKKYKTKNSLTYHIRRIHQKSDSLDDSGKVIIYWVEQGITVTEFCRLSIEYTLYIYCKKSEFAPFVFINHWIIPRLAQDCGRHLRWSVL